MTTTFRPTGTEATVDDLAGALSTDATTLIDVREAVEYVQAHVPGAQLIPMAQLSARVHDLPRGEPVYVICASGNRSSAMSDLLTSAGIEAYSVAGGTSAWIRSGRPVSTGRDA